MQTMKRYRHRMLSKLFYLLWFTLFCQSLVYPQAEPGRLTEDGLDFADWRAESENGYRAAMEEIEENSSQSINLNSASIENISVIPGLNAFQRSKLLDYMKNYGEVYSLYELVAVEGFDSCLIRKIAPYIHLDPVSHSPPMTFKNLARYGKHVILLGAVRALPKAVGYNVPISSEQTTAANFYQGNPFGISIRYTYTFADCLRIGFSGDKDPGEQFFAGGQKYGMDYYSGFISLSAEKILKRLIIGNFRAGWGLGLTFNTGSSLGIYPGFNQEFSAASGIRPTQSVSEGNVLRGIAFSLGAGHFTLNGLCSYRKRDATVSIEDTITGRANAFSSFIETGYHRTASEIAKKGRVTELIFGGNLSFRGNFFSLGVTAYSVSLSARLQPRQELYNHFAFTGRYNFVTGADFNIFYRFLRITGEISRSSNGSIALITGLNLNPDPRFSAVLLYRNYPPDFQNLYANCFRQNTYCSNEKGLFMSFSASLPWRFSLSVFADFCKFPWAKYAVNMPSAANDAGVSLTWQANSGLNILIRYVYSSADANIVLPDEAIHASGTESSDDLRFQLNWAVSQAVTLQSRVEIKNARPNFQKKTTGWLLFQDISLKPLKFPLKVVFRYSVFDCPYYDSRIWAYEPDVLYGYSMPAYYGQGIRTCMLITYSAGRHVVISFKGGLTRYSDKNVISSGLDLIDANWKLDLTAQLRIRI